LVDGTLHSQTLVYMKSRSISIASRLLLAVLSLSLLAFAGCKQSDPSASVEPMDIYGVKVDLPKLDAAMSKASAELQSAYAGSKHSLRYRQFMQAVMDLDKFSQTPGLNDEQKKLIAQVMEQLKQVIQKAPAGQ